MVKMPILMLPEEVWTFAAACLLVAAAGALGAMAPSLTRRASKRDFAPANDNDAVGHLRRSRLSLL
jgi:hypothetical protein